MLRLIKNLFSRPRPEPEEVAGSKLEEWFLRKTSQLNFNAYFQEYFRRVKEIKLQVQSQILKLKNADIPKEHQNAEEKIKNIVRGHRDNYVREIELFTEKIIILERNSFSSLEDYQEALSFNQSLDQKLEWLAQRTFKSYSAAQHLFFNEVEGIFKSIGSLNSLVKEFKEKDLVKTIISLQEIKSLTWQLTEHSEKKSQLLRESSEKEKIIIKKKQELIQQKEELSQYLSSKEYRQWLELKKQQESLGQHVKENENEIFTFFSKLSKPLKKYERLALEHNQQIKEYLNNSLAAFQNDRELAIKLVLSQLRESLETSQLQFEEKQKRGFLELIKRGESDYLDQLRSESKKLAGEKGKIIQLIHENEAHKRIEHLKEKSSSIQEEISQTGRELDEIKNKLGKTDLTLLTEEIEQKINLVFKQEVRISLSKSF